MTILEFLSRNGQKVLTALPFPENSPSRFYLNQFTVWPLECQDFLASREEERTQDLVMGLWLGLGIELRLGGQGQAGKAT